ncbi:hypothetical protein CC79DRAFT_1335000 [Sarocladium strictum]
MIVTMLIGTSSTTISSALPPPPLQPQPPSPFDRQPITFQKPATPRPVWLGLHFGGGLPSIPITLPSLRKLTSGPPS